MINKRNSLIAAVVYMLLTFGLVVFLDAETTAMLTEEDFLFEYLTSIGFAISSVLFFLMFLRAWKSEKYTILRKLSYLALSFVFFFGAGEEISWGQRIFNIETPEAIAEVNHQGELTFHNLEIFKGDGMIDITDLFNLFWLTFTFLVPVSAAVLPRLRDLYEKFMPVVPWEFGVIFLVNWGIAKLGGIAFRQGIDVSYIVHDMVETKESNYGVFFGILAIFLYFATRSETSATESAE